MKTTTDIRDDCARLRPVQRGTRAGPAWGLVSAIAVLAFALGGCTVPQSGTEAASVPDEVSDPRGASESSMEGQLDGSEQHDNESEGVPNSEAEMSPDRPIEDEPDRPIEDESDRPNEDDSDEFENDTEDAPSEEDEAEEVEPESEPEAQPEVDANPPENTPVRHILPLGDSITEGVPFTYRPALHDKLTRANYAFDFVGSHTNGAEGYPEDGWDRDNEGWAGWTTESIREELAEWSAAYTVDIALIHLGTNDAGGNDVDASASAMTGIIEHLRANNGAVSICIAQILPFGWIPPEPGAPGTTELNEFVDNWNARLSTLAANLTTPDSPIVLVDMNSEFGEADLDDGVHPTREGAERMADKWLECILSF